MSLLDPAVRLHAVAWHMALLFPHAAHLAAQRPTPAPTEEPHRAET